MISNLEKSLVFLEGNFLRKRVASRERRRFLKLKSSQLLFLLIKKGLINLKNVLLLNNNLSHCRGRKRLISVFNCNYMKERLNL